MRHPLTIGRQRGFSLIELMVAVVVGMLAMIFATRLLVTSEQQKSAAVGGSDSMQNGMLAMFQINTDAAQAGWGINDALVNGCNTLMQDTEGFQLTPATRNQFVAKGAVVASGSKVGVLLIDRQTQARQTATFVIR